VPVEVIMPKVDMDMATGKLAAWHVAEGEAVAKGAPLFDIETDKAAMEVEAPASGRLHHVIAAPGATVAVGEPVAWIYAEGEAVGAVPAGAPSPAPSAAPEAMAESAPAPEAAPAEGARATPAARRLARTAGIELHAIAGTGPHGRIQREDVERLVEAPKPAAGSEAAGELHVSTRKGTGTPVLLLHGFTGDSTGWLPLERELPADVPLIRIDLPSHGKSPRPPVASFEALVGAVTAAFDRAVTGEVHVVAHSLGGAVAIALADQRPRRVASMTLLAPAGLGAEIDAAALLGIARASRVESLAPWLKRLTATPDGISRDFAKAAMLARGDPAMRAAQVELAEVLFPDGVQGFDVTAALARVTAPTAIVWGRGDRIIPWRQALAARGEMALHLLPGIGHIPHVESPEVVAEVLARNMRRAARP
jgi:pyruvate dehydrogenase E2 component (dihydrolipoamide acetyltransferase)